MSCSSTSRNNTNPMTEENRRRLLDSLSTYDYLTPYKKACKMRHPATAEWLLQSTNFTCWEEGTCSPWFWCSGKSMSDGVRVTVSNCANRSQSDPARQSSRKYPDKIFSLPWLLTPAEAQVQSNIPTQIGVGLVNLSHSSSLNSRIRPRCPRKPHYDQFFDNQSAPSRFRMTGRVNWPS